ncbi:hypothetical protein CRM22_001307 [Opisthorchis felineus]|uniref:Dynein regulatory complex protein 10 n=1 Tax=Opisthorchis felineus TaxID=147828 RepID=A0A4S2MHP1_OPIFE|nr:hypothetical protein CRM22_001307 [Opisthorchis felineus]
MLTTKIPCQQFSSRAELIPQSRHLPSKDAQLTLHVIDSTICKCLYVILMKGVSTRDSCECSKEDEDLHILISEFEELAEKYDIFACGNCTQPTTEAKHNKEKEVEDALNQQHCDSMESSGNSSQGFEFEVTHRRFANQEVQMNSIEKSEDEKTSNRVNSLQNEMNNLQNYMKERVKRTVDEEQQRKNLILQKSQEKQAELEKELCGLKASYSKAVEDNQKAEVRQRNQVYKMETELESVIQKFDRDMMALQSEYDQLDEEYTNDKLELTELEEKFSTLEEEYLKIMEKRRLEEEKRQQEEEEQRVLEEGVTTIQAFWRSYQTRKAVRGRREGSQKRKK